MADDEKEMEKEPRPEIYNRRGGVHATQGVWNKPGGNVSGSKGGTEGEILNLSSPPAWV